MDVAGVEAPSIEAYPKAQSHRWPCGENKDGKIVATFQISKEQISQRLDGVKLWSPVLYPGDAVLLHSYTVHRTHIREEMTGLSQRFLNFALHVVPYWNPEQISTNVPLILCEPCPILQIKFT